MTKKAFTLIELLVVIAIIAILAAILFPVFAQAKLAAKGTASLSNIKQLGTASMIYMSDYDDVAPVDIAWGSGPVTLGGVPLSTWAWNMYPYMKNADMLQDPLTSSDAIPTGWPKHVRYTITPQYGYNYSVWSPYTGAFATTPWLRTPISNTAVGEVSNTVLFASKFAQAELGGFYWYGAGTIVTSLGVEPPDCYSRSSWCFAGFGVSGNYSPLLGTSASGKYTGGDSRRKSEKHVVGLGDSSAKVMGSGQLAAGTNFANNTTQTEDQIVITDSSKYMWDQN